MLLCEVHKMCVYNIYNLCIRYLLLLRLDLQAFVVHLRLLRLNFLFLLSNSLCQRPGMHLHQKKVANFHFIKPTRYFCISQLLIKMFYFICFIVQPSQIIIFSVLFLGGQIYPSFYEAPFTPSEIEKLQYTLLMEQFCLNLHFLDLQALPFTNALKLFRS